MSSRNPAPPVDEDEDDLARELEAAMQEGYERWVRLGKRPLGDSEPWMLTDEADNDERWEQYYREQARKDRLMPWRKLIRFIRRKFFNDF